MDASKVGIQLVRVIGGMNLASEMFRGSQLPKALLTWGDTGDVASYTPTVVHTRLLQVVRNVLGG